VKRRNAALRRRLSSDNRLAPAILLRQAKSTENIRECNSAPRARLANLDND